MLPAIVPLALGLAGRYIPEAIGWLKGDKAEDAARDILDVAKKITKTEDDEYASDALINDKTLGNEFRLEVLKLQQARDQLYLNDRQNARETYAKQSGTADLIATGIMNRSLLLILLLVAANFGALYLLGEKAELIALISNLIGVVIGALLNERNSVISFFFGGVSNDK
ncbi:hypothetical protein HNP12_000635 [Aeromonas hydrophila]|uniref:hypothetical protein n=1 Tax=Aeromonas hydrophila TaxID=644 RepID=UPI00216701C3|nr:hypothetical protein [Aeromonas hydrophila]MCS3766587.1 hypothetical protein [Aeromonas hydrophila]